MSIRIRTIDGKRVALCAARSMPQPGDVYLDDSDHYALAQKFTEDFRSEGFDVDADNAAVRAEEESNNPNREWWDATYGVAGPSARTGERDG